jgi:hypothetical protein
VLAITYAGNHGYDEQVTNADANGWTRATNFYPNGFAGLPLAAPDPRFVTVSQVLTSGISNYDALTVAIRHAMSHGFQAQGGWTWSHTLGTNGIYNPYNLQMGYGPLAFDTRHQVTGDIVWNSPKFSSNLVNNVLGGWTISGKFFLYTGPPFSVTNSSLAARINSTNSGLGNTILADVIDPTALGVKCGANNIATANGVACLHQSQFATTTTQLDFGNSAPDMFRGAGYFDIDSQISKNFTIREKLKFGVGAYFTNLLNHPNFANASGTVTSSSIGLASSTVAQPSSIYGTGQGASVSGRLMVLTAKFRF